LLKGLTNVPPAKFETATVAANIRGAIAAARQLAIAAPLRDIRRAFQQLIDHCHNVLGPDFLALHGHALRGRKAEAIGLRRGDHRRSWPRRNDLASASMASICAATGGCEIGDGSENASSDNAPGEQREDGSICAGWPPSL